MYESIKAEEGLELKAYKCQAGVPTIGYGTTVYPDGRKVKIGDTCTKKQAEEWFDSYMKKNVEPHISVFKLPKKAHEALASLVYNIGGVNFKASKLPALLKTKDYGAIMQNWIYTKANGISSRGLARRRARELVLFFEDFQ